MNPLKDSSEIQEAIRLLKEISEESQASRTGAPWEVPKPPFPTQRREQSDALGVDRAEVGETGAAEPDEVRTTVMQLAEEESAVLAQVGRLATADRETREPSRETLQETPESGARVPPFPVGAATEVTVTPIDERIAAGEGTGDAEAAPEEEPQPPWVGMVEARVDPTVQSNGTQALDEAPPGGTPEVY